MIMSKMVLDSMSKFPVPVMRDRQMIYSKDTGLDVWLKKLREEYREAAVEAADGNTEALAMELQDIIHVCTTWQATLGYNLDKRQVLCQRVNFKNFKRGYFSLNGADLAYSLKKGLLIKESEKKA